MDKLKIDRSFLAQANVDMQHGSIVRTIIELAKGLKIDVVAEGIETQHQLAQLKNMKCKLGQGYLFAKPLDEKSVETLIIGEAAGIAGTGVFDVRQDMEKEAVSF